MSFSKPGYDVIVVGAGIEGSSCAYNLAKQGRKVLLLEQFPLPHTRGSSHGQSRITRYAYSDAFYVRMMVDAFPLWDTLEKEVDQQLFVNCGVLDIRPSPEAAQSVVSALSTYNIPHERLDARQVRQRFPAVVMKDEGEAVYDPNGGLLKADRALAAFQRVFKQLGGTVHDEEPVQSITPGSVITVVTARCVYTTSSLVLATGPWTPEWATALGVKLHLKPIRVLPMYWRIQPGKEKIFSAKNFPCFILAGDRDMEDSFECYGLPCLEYPGLVKVAHHCGPGANPNARDQLLEDGQFVEQEVTQAVKKTFPGLEARPAIVEQCMYTLTPDNHPYIDRHPKYSNIVFAAGFSGHGFKLAPAVGKAVTELVLGMEPTYDMKHFSIGRFDTKSNL